MKIVTWRLYEACGVYILELEDRTVIHMLVERRLMKSDDVNGDEKGLSVGLITTQQMVIISTHHVMAMKHWLAKSKRYLVRQINSIDGLTVLPKAVCSKIYKATYWIVAEKNCCKDKVQFRRTSLTGFLAQSIISSNAIALDSPYLLVLITGTSQSRQHESCKSPTKSLFDVGSRRISIVNVNTKEYHSDVLAIITRIMLRFLMDLVISRLYKCTFVIWKSEAGADCHLFNINDLEMRKPIETRSNLAKISIRTDAKRCGCHQIQIWRNDESKKIKSIYYSNSLKDSLVSHIEGLHKAMKRFPKSTESLEIMGQGVSIEMQKSEIPLDLLPSAWSSRLDQSTQKKKRRYALMAGNSSGSDTEKLPIQMSVKKYDGILSYENEVLQSVFMGKESDFENPPLYDRFVTAGGMHAVPPPMTGNYMPFGPDIEIDYSKFTYGPKQTQPSESETQTSDIDTCESNISTNQPELVSEPVVNESIIVSQPKVWSDAPIFENDQIVKINKGIVDRDVQAMTGNKAYLAEYQDYNGSHVAFGELQHSIFFSVSQMWGKRTSSVYGPECLGLSPEFKLPEEIKYYLEIPRQNIERKATQGPPVRLNQCALLSQYPYSYLHMVCLDLHLDSKKEDESLKTTLYCHRVFFIPQQSKGSIAKDAGDAPYKHPNLKTNGKPVDKEDQVFFDELKRLKRQEQDANDAAEALRNEFAHKVRFAFDMHSTNILNTASTPVSTASPYDGLSFSDLTNPDQDDSEIPALEDIYKNPTDGIFTNSSYDDEGAVADFTNLETVENVSPIPTSRINSIHPSTLILGDPQSAVQTRSKVTKSSGAHAFDASTPIETQKPLVKDEEASDVDVHLYRSMIGSLMYLTASRPDIMFAVCACSRFQVTPKTSHLSVVKRIFRYLKGKPKLGLWYPRVSSFDLEAYSDSDYAGANLDRKSTTGGCQFLGRRLISWQCKKQTIVATSTTEAEYVAAANCCGQVLWIQNQMLDYGFNFMNTKIYIDNESTICIVKNPVYHSKTKHIAIRHHFIRDAYEKKLIQCAEAFLTIGDEFQEVHWVFKSPWEEIKTHNMIAYLENSEGNADFMKLLIFLARSSIYYALTVTDQAKEIKTLKAQIKKLKKQAKPIISHHRAWMKSISLKQRLAGKKSLKSNWMQKESENTEDAQDVGRLRCSKKKKKNADAEVSTEDVLSTAQQKVSTDKEKVSTDSTKVSTDRSKVSTGKEKDNDETIAQVLLNMSQAKAVSREKEKGVEFKDVEETERPRPTSTRSLLTLKPLPKIDPKDKGKKKIKEEDESETESEGIPEAEKKFKLWSS
ncbi:hypothetical protein Tco_0270209 [Tanacetum coccineum]